MHQTLQMPRGEDSAPLTVISTNSSNLDFYEFSSNTQSGNVAKETPRERSNYQSKRPFTERRYTSPNVAASNFAQSVAAASRGGPPHDATGGNSSLQLATRPVKRRRGGKIYSGCATCRERKIKCDQRRPICYNCEKSRHHICDGYVAQDSGVVPPGSRNPDLLNNGETIQASMEDPKAQISPEANTDHDSRIADSLLQEDEEVDSSEHQMHQIPYAEVLDDLSAFQHWADASMMGSSQDPTGPSGFNFSPLLFPQGPFQSFPMDPLDMSYLAENYLIHEDSAEPGVQSSQEDTSNSRRPHLSRDISPKPSRRQSPRPFGRRNSNPLSPGTFQSEISSLSQATRKLLYHYQTHVCQLMMPTAAPSHNPWLRLYLPIALQEPRTSAKQALFHAILAVAAFNQAELYSADAMSYRIQAVEHSEEAARLIKSVVSSSKKSRESFKDPLDKRALLAAALTMTTIEVFSGANEGKGYEHLRVAKDVVELTGGINWWLSDAANVTLLQIFRCLRIISYTSGWSEPKDIRRDQPKEGPTVVQVESPSAEDAPADEAMFNSSSPPCEYTLDVSFGISMKTLWCLNKIVDLEATKCSMVDGDSWSDGNINDLMKLENELYSLMDNPSAFSNYSTHPQNGDVSSFPSENSGISHIVTEEIKENHVWAFHYSVALFFRRALCGGGAHVKPPTANTSFNDTETRRPTGQYLVSKALEYLENIDAISFNIPIANTLWPGFIAAVEAVDTELRHRALVWFARATRHGIGNIAKAKALVLEVWRRVDRQTYVSHERKNLCSELGPVDWRDVMREKGMYIMLT